MEGEDNDPCPSRNQRADPFDTSSSDSDSDYDIRPGRSRKQNLNALDDTDSDSGSSIDVLPRKKSRPTVLTESDSSSSGSDIVRRKRSAFRIPSDDDSFQSDWSIASVKDTGSQSKKQALDNSSSDSDGQSDKCPICLLAFKNQEVGSPESCDHSFCVECIQEWSKNVNTCPVDRQPFNLILVRSHYNGKIISQLPVEPRNQQNEDNLAVEDPTYCEICGNCDREDRMLLCDGCDLGYHLECLSPALGDVPVGLWYCSECGPEDVATDLTIYLHEVELLLNDSQDMAQPTGPRSRNATRLVPRTRQSERVRARIMTNRTQTRNGRREVEEQIQVVVSQNIGPSTSKQRRKKKSKRRRRKPNIKITYDIDEDTGQKIVIQTKTRRRKRKVKRSRRARLAAGSQPPKTVKKRLAVQLGMCAPRTSGQAIPEVRINASRNNIGHQRSQAGIPTLHLFGSRDDDFFSGSDADNEGEGPSLLLNRRHNMSDRAVLRRAANRKSVLLPHATSSCDLLDSILDSQEKFHSKNAVLSLKKDGTIEVGSNKNPMPVNNNSDRVNLNHFKGAHVRKAPMCSNATTAQTGTGSSSTVSNSDDYRNSVNSVANDTVTTTNNAISTSNVVSSGGGNGDSEPIQDYSIRSNCDEDEEPKKSLGNSPRSESELDIYSDIETVSTSKAEASKGASPIPEAPLNIQSDDEANNSDVSLVIDTEKLEEKAPAPEDEHESKEEDVTSTTNVGPPTCVVQSEEQEEKSCDEDDNDSEDGCPNFSMYSAESINLAKTTDLELLNQEANVGSSLDVTENRPDEEEHPPPPSPQEDERPPQSPEPEPKKYSDSTGLYSDSDEEVAKVDVEKPFGIGDIRSLTEDISEEERSYTPCLDERVHFREGLEGLETEAISDEEKNDFDEAQELKTASDGGDALEINAKECELDFTKPEEYEEGEIVDKLKKMEEAKKTETTETVAKVTPEKKDSPVKESPAFKKISKSNKDRNYRDKEKQGNRSPSKENHNPKKKDRKRERRKEIERYNVRSVVAEKPRRLKDKFGRDARRRSNSRSSRSTSPQYRSVSRGRRSFSREKSRKRRARTHSGSRSRKRSRSRIRRRSASRVRVKRRRSRERSKNRKKNRSLSRQKTRSPSPRRRRDWERRSRGWSPSPSRSRSPVTPSWTPPRLLENQPVKPHNLTVILTNDSTKKKREKKRSDKKKKENNADKQKKRKRDKTPPPSKEVFASGDNILVSVSFNDEREREATIKRKRDDDVTTKRTRKEREKGRRDPKIRKKKSHDLSGIKPVAIIDLDRSPFKELTPSPKDIIVLSDSDTGENREDTVCDSSQQPDNYPTGPKTPPEPQVKFSLNAKPAQLRAISNPLHEPDDIDGEMDPQEELEQRLNDTLHKGPNTPPEPPNSPPSSPDAYDPFDPTKSRSPTPDNSSNVQSCIAQSTENNHNENSDTLDKLTIQQSPDISHTPPVLPDVQPADSQSNASTNTPDISTKQTPERNIGVVINQVVQSQASLFPTSLNKSQTQTTVYSSAPLVTSTPISTNLTTSRINILNTTILTPAAIMASLPQRIVLPTTTKSSPIKVSPTKPPIKSTPIKPMPNKNISKASKAATRKSNSRINNEGNESNIDLESPYSPGPSDYEDLFEPPTESISKATKSKQSNKGSSNKGQGSFDILFGSSPIHKLKSSNKLPDKKKKSGFGKGTKLVGVKVDEDSLKILDDLPNSAVEMQVKDKFLKKLNRQERVVEEVKLVLKPHYNKKHINKEEYKDILRRAVPKICHNKSGEINPKKIQNLIEAYVKKIRHSKKVTSSSSVNMQK